MTKGDNQKLKMLYLDKIFREETDDKHSLTLQEITARLNANGVNADRKTLYQDFDELRRYGLDIMTTNSGRSCRYYLASRTFELPELKLLVDSVQAAKFLTNRKSQMLIKKLESLTSHHQASELQRQVIINGRVKTMNKAVFLTVDKIYQALNQNVQVRFHYTKYNIQKKIVLRHNGDWFVVSPWALLLNDENYYLVAYDAQDQVIKHYRVDKIKDLELLDDRREGKESFSKEEIPLYTNHHFGMFNGEDTKVTLEAENDLAGVLIDRFGKDIMLIPSDENHVSLTVDVDVSRQFLGWVMSIGSGIRITAPDWVREKMLDEGKRLLEQYK